MRAQHAPFEPGVGKPSESDRRHLKGWHPLGCSHQGPPGTYPWDTGLPPGTRGWPLCRRSEPFGHGIAQRPDRSAAGQL